MNIKLMKIILLQEQSKSWSKPGEIKTTAPEKPAAAHPSGDRDSDSEEEEDNSTNQKETSIEPQNQNKDDSENVAAEEKTLPATIEDSDQIPMKMEVCEDDSQSVTKPQDSEHTETAEPLLKSDVIIQDVEMKPESVMQDVVETGKKLEIDQEDEKSTE